MSHPAVCAEKEELAGLADRRSGPGILILTPTACVLYMNRRGWELLRVLNTSHAVAAEGLMPAIIKDICSEIRELGRNPIASKDWEQLEIRRLTGSDEQPVLLRGFGLPGHTSEGQPRILVLMEVMGRRESAAVQAKERFQLTEREQSVVERLARGWTNKEIAAELKITEPTVKAHIRNIMEKTKCTTRTGIVAQVLHL